MILHIVLISNIQQFNYLDNQLFKFLFNYSLIFEKLQKKYSKSRQRLTAIEAQLQAIVSVIGRDQIDSMLKSSGKDTDLPKFPIEIEYEDGLSSSEDDDESAIEYGSDESE